MQRNFGKIEFESRRELEAISMALQEYLDRHDEDTYERSAVQELNDHLEVMHMTW